MAKSTDDRVTIPASPEAIEAVCESTGLSEGDVHLDLLCQHGVFGTQDARERVLDYCKEKSEPGRDLTLTDVGDQLSELNRARLTWEMKSMAVPQAAVMDFDKAAEIILSLCDYDTRNRWIRIAQETSHGKPPAEIIASIVIRYCTELGYGDFGLVQSRDQATALMSGGVPSTSMLRPAGPGLSGKLPKECPAEVTFTCQAGMKSITHTFPLCGQMFVPSVGPERDQKFGCETCGEMARELQKWLQKKVDAEDRVDSGVFVDPMPTMMLLLQKGYNACTCGGG